MSDFIIRTSNFNTVFKLCNVAHMKTKMFGILGYPGAGKTTALLSYVQTHDYAHYVRVTASMNAKDFYRKLLNELGIIGVHKNTSLHSLINAISYHLNNEIEKQLIVIDEAGKFNPRLLEYLHELRDNTFKSTGIIISGPEYFRTNILNWTRKGVNGVPELYRRVNYWEKLLPPKKAEIRAFCDEYKIKDEKLVTKLSKEINNYSEIIDSIEIYLINNELTEK